MYMYLLLNFFLLLKSVMKIKQVHAHLNFMTNYILLQGWRQYMNQVHVVFFLHVLHQSNRIVEIYATIMITAETAGLKTVASIAGIKSYRILPIWCSPESVMYYIVTAFCNGFLFS